MGSCSFRSEDRETLSSDQSTGIRSSGEDLSAPPNPPRYNPGSACRATALDPISGTDVMEPASPEARLLGHVEWDREAAASDCVRLRATVEGRRLVLRNQFVHVRDEDGPRSGFLARVAAGPFF